MPSIQSSRNGLKINIPADARGVIGRFATKGDNELIFDKASLGGRRVDNSVSHIESPSATSEPAPKGRKRSSQKPVEDMV